MVQRVNPVKLPSTRALLAFEAAARLGSFQRAAEELGMTPSAVSHQIGGMESLLGWKLFDRLKNRVVLTEDGAAYVEDVRAALSLLGAATRRFLIDSGRRPLRIAVHPFVALNWLFPRMRSFHEAFPELRLDVIGADRPMDLFASDADLAISFGQLDMARSLGHDILFQRTATPVCSAAFFDRHPVSHVDDLKRLPVIANLKTFSEWAHWLGRVGADLDDLRSTFSFSDRSLTIAAVREGLGVGLGCRNLLSKDIETRVLVAPFAEKLVHNDGYFLVGSSSFKEVGLYRRVRQWIITQAGGPEGS